ncbi:MAG: cytochrome c-type biogenesis protein [Paracoccaceae bacterium]
MRRVLLAVFMLLAVPAYAVQPDEVLDDPALEARARSISANLRCPVCQGENIDESNAPVSRDLRLLVRERLLAGDSDAEVTRFITDRYGEYVLFRPAASGANWLLWLAGPGLFVIGLGGAVLFLRSRAASAAPAATPLTEAERMRLDELLRGPSNE